MLPMGLFVKGTSFFRFQNLLGSVSISGSDHLEMGQKRLSGMVMMSIHPDQVPSADEVLDRFMSLKNRRIHCER